MTFEAVDICKAFDGFEVLRNVSMSMPLDGLIGLIGPNGAGKSTLFSVISGFMPPSSGHVTFDGVSMNGMSASTRARAGMVRTFQVPKEFSHLSVRENLMAAAPGQAGENLTGLFLRPGLVRRQEDGLRKRADAVISFLRLDRVADSSAGLLSGGQKKLLELGRALMVEPKLILLDEPFAGVNPVLIGEIMERIRELNGRGIGFLIIEHDLDALTRLVSRLYVMDQGAILAEGEPVAVLADKAVRDAYLGGEA
ncbi:ABC transporter ATP-binding protein [Chelativorans xinjiangense]|uniref:ABC transporter ATP-binding protein n=1 Tax=Chelativorans xinjiangense TaxID=2681485 RepID=UPI001358174A|nr:ABC transporter ATP-binding protein [Chelativorans xinjiangense]